MNFLIPSFLAGVLTILAPCILSLLPVVLGGSVTSRDRLRPLIVIGSLGFSVILFSLMLKGTTAFISIPTSFWQFLSGGLIILIGGTMLFPKLWEELSLKLQFYRVNTLFSEQKTQEGFMGAVFLGLSLGPIFSTCSPTYGLIVATILPLDFLVGFVNLIAYTLGFMIPLLIIGYGGRSVVHRIKFAANPEGVLKRSIGALLIIVGIFLTFGLDKKIETFLLENGYTGPIEIERSFLPEL